MYNFDMVLLFLLKLLAIIGIAYFILMIGSLLLIQIYFPGETLMKIINGPDKSIFKKIDKPPQDIWNLYLEDHCRGVKEREEECKIGSIYSIVETEERKNIVQNFKKHKKNKKTKLLYHGTSLSAYESICKTGFKLPKQQGQNMFGAGVYFASVPQKANDYTPTGYILICEVIVGKPKIVTKSDVYFDPNENLNKKYLFGLIKKKYKAVHAPAGICTISDEYIIYNPEYALPLYLIQIE